jgi:glycosyltransferase involved in cell wall biosynthesis
MNSFTQPLVSVVVPAYNEAEHIGECIESILAQTYQNWECIVVDNCSTDGTAELARRYAAKDVRIRVGENKKFVRAVPNYNGALRQISRDSKYCKIVFSDDWIFPECLERMVELAEEQPSVGIVGAYGLQGRQIMWAGLPYPSKIVPGREICRKLFLEDLYVFGTGTSLLFRSSLVREHKPFYNESNLHADSETCIALLKQCDFGFVNQVLSFTRVRDGSLFDFSREMNTLIAGRLYDLVNYGPHFLTPEEYKTCLDEKVAEYYDFLGKNLPRRRGEKFWSFHSQKLTEAGIGLNRARVLRVFLARVVDAALNPKKTCERILKGKAPSHDPAFLPGFEERKQNP